MAQNKQDEERTATGSSRHTTCDPEGLAATAGGPPGLPRWYRERQFDLFGFPSTQGERHALGHDKWGSLPRRQ